MHTEKQEIFDKYAKSKGFEDWDHLLNDFECKLMTIDEFEYFMFEACDLVQQEQQSRIAKNIKMIDLNEGRSEIECYVLDKNSITNPENLIQ